MLRILSVILGVVFAVVGSSFAATFTVVNIDDDGAGSLRQALADADALTGEDLVQFAIPGASCSAGGLLQWIPNARTFLQTTSRVAMWGAGVRHLHDLNGSERSSTNA